MGLKLFRQHGNALTITGPRDAFKDARIEEPGVLNDPRMNDMLNPYAKGGQYDAPSTDAATSTSATIFQA